MEYTQCENTLAWARDDVDGKLESLLTQFIAIATNGRKIAAIKAVRQVTNLGLKDSKDLVDTLTTTRCPHCRQAIR